MATASVARRQAVLQMPVDSADLAYLAGVLDGEGCISRREDRPRTWRIHIHNGNRPLIEHLLRVGGYAHEHNPQHRPAHWTPTWIWTIGAKEDVLLFLESVLPWLIVKRDRAIEAIADLEVGRL